MRASIAEAKAYLKANHDGTWGVVNIITHSYPWSGLSVKLNQTDAQILDVFALNKIISSKTFKPLTNDVIDHMTEIRVFACGLGKHRRLLSMLWCGFMFE